MKCKTVIISVIISALDRRKIQNSENRKKEFEMKLFLQKKRAKQTISIYQHMSLKRIEKKTRRNIFVIFSVLCNQPVLRRKGAKKIRNLRFPPQLRFLCKRRRAGL
uniref:(northern house mosquito) hypothetical protein n=1 Tax=Culex pipiens TaxID=7175 RepID=A0A8D8JIU7_CULPI